MYVNGVYVYLYIYRDPTGMDRRASKMLLQCPAQWPETCGGKHEDNNQASGGKVGEKKEPKRKRESYLSSSELYCVKQGNPPHV